LYINSTSTLDRELCARHLHILGSGRSRVRGCDRLAHISQSPHEVDYLHILVSRLLLRVSTARATDPTYWSPQRVNFRISASLEIEYKHTLLVSQLTRCI